MKSKSPSSGPAVMRPQRPVCTMKSCHQCNNLDLADSAAQIFFRNEGQVFLTLLRDSDEIVC